MLPLPRTSHGGRNKSIGTSKQLNSKLSPRGSIVTHHSKNSNKRKIDVGQLNLAGINK